MEGKSRSYVMGAPETPHMPACRWCNDVGTLTTREVFPRPVGHVDGSPVFGWVTVRPCHACLAADPDFDTLGGETLLIAQPAK